jgi:hypothetical protein
LKPSKPVELIDETTKKRGKKDKKKGKSVKPSATNDAMDNFGGGPSDDEDALLAEWPQGDVEPLPSEGDHHLKLFPPPLHLKLFFECRLQP